MFAGDTTKVEKSFVVQQFKDTLAGETDTMMLTDQPAHQVSLFEYNLETYLESKVRNYPLAFNTYVPGKRLVIDAIGVDAPIVDVKAATQEKLEK
ncbi:MAG: hypothetical protein H6765_07595 [Candidatus Peribacteria bacterium]|nr:MAG: hypothetical protein H6765_07595 [Candidatus Peribacteria bacterium]